MTPTQRSLAKLRAAGWLVAVVERWNPYARIRQDLFGFADLLAIRGHETLAVQTTSGANFADRLAKILENQNARLWLESPNRAIAIHGWAKRGPRGKRKVWTCREELLCGSIKQPGTLDSAPAFSGASAGARAGVLVGPA